MTIEVLARPDPANPDVWRMSLVSTGREFAIGRDIMAMTGARLIEDGLADAKTEFRVRFADSRKPALSGLAGATIGLEPDGGTLSVPEPKPEPKPEPVKEDVKPVKAHVAAKVHPKRKIAHK